MKTRVISALVMVAILVVCLFASEFTRVILFCVVGVLCAYEFLKRLDENGVHCAAWVPYLFLAVMFILTITHSGWMAYIAWFVIAVYLALFSGVLHPEVAGKGALSTIAVVAYPCFLAAMCMIVSISSRWLPTLLLAFFCTYLCDTFALLGGSRFGKHKLAPHVSPNKTVEGSVCGAIASVIFAIPVWFAIKSTYTMPLWAAMLTGLIASTAGQIGDLSESLIKRYLNVKDFSNLIPGHGGMFDRFDSVFFAIPTTYCCLYLVERFL